MLRLGVKGSQVQILSSRQGKASSEAGFTPRNRSDYALGAHTGHNSFRRRLLHAFRDRVEVVVEQPRLDVQSHRRRRMPEHPLHALDVRAGTHCQAGRRVP